MKRLTFLGSLLGLTGISNAQQWKECKPTVVLRGSVVLHGGKLSGCSSRPLNGQCPVCGTMAEAYHRPMVEGAIVRNCRKADGELTLTCDAPEKIPNGPQDRVTRCKRCNAAFWQDAV